MFYPTLFKDDLFDDFFDFPTFRDFDKVDRKLYGKHANGLMKTDVRENEGNYELDIDLPGFKKDEISLDLKDGYLTISAEKGLDKDEEDKKGRILRQERYAGSCSRSFYVGDVKPEDIKAKYESGVLTVLVPKEDIKKSPVSTAITIE